MVPIRHLEDRPGIAKMVNMTTKSTIFWSRRASAPVLTLLKLEAFQKYTSEVNMP